MFHTWNIWKHGLMNRKIKLLLIEPSEIIAAGIKSILDESKSFEIQMHLREISRLEERIIALKPDVVLINPTVFGAVEEFFSNSIADKFPAVCIIALVYQYIEPGILEHYDAVIDICEKRNKIQLLIKETLEAKFKEKCTKSENYELSRRELAVLVELAKGLTAREIADELNISVYTVNSHRKNITQKTGIKSIAGLAVYAALHNLLDV